jgi:phosphohistidine phosphatase SixA
MTRLAPFGRISLLLAGVLTAGAAPAAAQEVIYVVRHAERTGGAQPTAESALTDAGHARAGALARHLDQAGITAIYVSETVRARDTAAPLAERLGLAPREASARAVEELIARVRREEPAGRVLIVGHSNTLPLILRALGHLDPVVIGDDDYDDLFIVVPAAGPLVLRHLLPVPWHGHAAAPAPGLHR